MNVIWHGDDVHKLQQPFPPLVWQVTTNEGTAEGNGEGTADGNGEGNGEGKCEGNADGNAEGNGVDTAATIT